LRLVDLVGLDDTERQAVYYAALLVNVGCHTDAYEQARWFGDDIAMRATKYEYEPFSARDIAAMLRMLGSGGTPLHRVRVAFDFAVSGRKQLDGDGLTPDRTIHGLQRDTRLVKEKLT